MAPQALRSHTPTLLCGAFAAAGAEACGGLRRPRPRPLRGGSSPAQPRPFRGCGSLTGESCAVPEPRPELPPARVPSPRGRQPLRERLPGAHRSHHLLRRFTKWPPARSAAPGSRRGGIKWFTSWAGRRKRTEVFGHIPEIAGVWGERSLGYFACDFCVRAPPYGSDAERQSGYSTWLGPFLQDCANCFISSSFCNKRKIVPTSHNCFED